MSENKKGATPLQRINPPLKWHSPGGKNYLAKRIIELMPPRCVNPNAPTADDPGYLHYCEPYAGGLAVLLANNPEGISEVVNDLNGPLSNFWRCLQHAPSFNLFAQYCRAIPFSEENWKRAAAHLEQPCAATDTICQGCALAFFVCCHMSLAGRMKSFAPLSRTRTRRGMNKQASAWLNCIEGLPAVHERLKRVVILNRDALDVIRQQDGPQTLFYCDPPYLHETRATTGEYAHEMTADQHLDLLRLVRECKGKVMISGYRSAMYDTLLAHWNRHDWELPNNAASGETKRRMRESLWCNY